MDIQKIIADLQNERERLDRAIAALEAADSQPSASKRRTLIKPLASSNMQLPSSNMKSREGITEQRRKRLSESMKKSWAERRKKA